MGEYKFYGWENDTIKDGNGLTLRDYYDILSDIWCSKTCAQRLREQWSPDNKTLGQCSVTAFNLQDAFGGKVYGIPLEEGGFHCFNIVGDIVFDLTSEQFKDGGLKYEDRVEQFREEHFKNTEKRARYDYLKDRLKNALEKRTRLK